MWLMIPVVGFSIAVGIGYWLIFDLNRQLMRIRVQVQVVTECTITLAKVQSQCMDRADRAGKESGPLG